MLSREGCLTLRSHPPNTPIVPSLGSPCTPKKHKQTTLPHPDHVGSHRSVTPHQEGQAFLLMRDKKHSNSKARGIVGYARPGFESRLWH